MISHSKLTFGLGPAFIIAFTLAGCGGNTTDLPDAQLDVGTDVLLDANDDAAIDAISDVRTDLSVDTAVDSDDIAATDTTPDIATDATDDAAVDTNDDPGPLPPWPERPALVTRPDRKAAILARLDGAPWDEIIGRIRSTAGGTCAPDTNTNWSSGVHRTNGAIAQANAVLAWLLDDEAAAAKTRDCFMLIRTDWETSEAENHTMPEFQIPFTVAWDLMAGTAFFPAEIAEDARARLVSINEKFFDKNVLDDFVRWSTLTVTHNNITIRSTSGMAYVALAFPDAARSREILDFAAGELEYLWGPDGRYIGEDGVVSEEPFYFGYGFSPPLAFFLAMRNTWPTDGVLHRNCINRNDVDPWAPINCTNGDHFAWEDPLAAPGANAHSDRFWKAFDWSLDHRMPSGLRSTTGDGKARVQTCGLLLASLSGRGRYAWDSFHNINNDVQMNRGLDMTPQHLFEIVEMPAEEEPSWTSAAHLTSGHVTMRSGWGPDDLWILILGESGAARKTLHDHADGTSYALAAYGEYLLLDAGYYKPNAMKNAVTADSPSHNVILIDGKGAPQRGLLNDWGDTDAFVNQFVDGTNLDFTDVTQTYQQTTINRAMIMVRDRYAVVADTTETLVNGPREHTWRVNGFSGYDSGGTYSIDLESATFEKPAAGIRVGIAATDGAPDIHEPAYEQNKAPHVHDIGDSPYTTHHAVADASINAVAPGFLAILAPWKIGATDGTAEAPLTLTRLASEAGSAAWAVTGVFGTDIIWMRTPDAPDSLTIPGDKEISTDAALVIVNLQDGLLMYRGGTGVSWDSVLHTAASAGEDLAINDK
jgi:hypothetical protein